MYYPKSQITPNLYTNGKEFIVEATKIDYIGYYYKTSNGECFVGKAPMGQDQIKIIPGTPPQPTNTNFKKLITNSVDMKSNFISNSYPNKKDFQPRSLPTLYISKPTTEEIKLGEYERYFSKKSNELIYIEISKEEYIKYQSQNPTVAWDLYDTTSIPWALSTNKSTRNIYNINLKTVLDVEGNKKWFGFVLYFNYNFA